MAQYRLLSDHFINNQHLPAGAVVTTGVEVPSGWTGSGNAEPLDSAATALFFSAGPQLPSAIHTVFAFASVLPPTTRWISAVVGGQFQWSLSELGQSLGVWGLGDAKTTLV